MDCPVCNDSPMITLELDNVEIDHCFKCLGIWLDAGELEMLLDDHQKAENLLNQLKPAQKYPEKSRKCPICLKQMNKIAVISDKSEILLDKCSKNHGLWFDKGELPNILSSAGLDPGHKIQQLLSEIFAETTKTDESSPK